jgi:hypothetical protein
VDFYCQALEFCIAEHARARQCTPEHANSHQKTQCTPEHASARQSTPIHPRARQCTPEHARAPQSTPVHARVRQCTPEDVNARQSTPVHARALQFTPEHFSVTDPAEASLHPGFALTPKSTLSLMSRRAHSLVTVRVLT